MKKKEVKKTSKEVKKVERKSAGYIARHDPEEFERVQEMLNKAFGDDRY